MSDTEDFSHLDDLAFLAERRRVRDELEHAPENQPDAVLASRLQRLNGEFLRRARIAWTQVS